MADDQHPLLRRTDDIADLVWQLLGDESAPPDITAAVPLFDALEDKGYKNVAVRLLESVSSLAHAFLNMESGNHPTLDDPNEFVRSILGDAVGEFRYDLGSMTAYIGREMQRLAPDAQPQLEEQVKPMRTVRMAVNRPYSIGERLYPTDGRTLMVVSNDEPGFVNAVPVDDIPSATDGMMNRPTYGMARRRPR